MITKSQSILFVLISIVLINMSTLFSQDISSIGLKAGLNLATVKSDSEPFNQVGWRYGFSFGAFITVPLTEKIYIQPELYYTQKGYDYDEKFNEIKVESRLDLNYIEFPILLTFKLSDKLKMFFGPAYSYYLNGEFEQKIIGGGFGYVHQKNNISSKDIENSDFSVVFGGSITYDIFILDLKYTFGFTNVSKFPQPVMDFRNRTIQILLGISLGQLDI